MSSPLFADISSYQTVTSWPAYYAWSLYNGVSRIAMRATEGVGFKDAKFESFWTGAQAARVQVEAIYHYARPDLNPGASGAADEAHWYAGVVGNRLAQAPVMLDYEQNEDRAWAHAWHDAIAWPAGAPKPVLYDSVSHFNQFFAGDLSLAAKFDCALAAWYPLNNGPPPAPPGWVMRWWQWTDNQAPRPVMSVPGISAPVDLNLWLGGSSMIPSGATYPVTIGTEIPDIGIHDLAQIVYGLSFADFCGIAGNSGFIGYDNNPASVHGLVVHLPGYQPKAPPATAKLVIDATSIRAEVV